MNKYRVPCLCTYRKDIRCDEKHCDIAGPGEPGNPNSCRVCWLRLGKPAVKGPGLPRKVYNYLTSIFHHVRRGMPIASKGDAKKRISLCMACEFYDAENDACSKCGCNMHAKTALASMRCGDDPPRWVEVPPVKAGLLEKLRSILPYAKSR